MDKRIFSIVIPNWNGRKLLENNIPKVIEASDGNEIIIIDDASTDGSVDLLDHSYPEVKLIVHKENIGFSGSCNDGVKLASGEIVILLNTDVVPSRGFLKPILRHFQNPKMFAVSLGEVSSGPGWAIFKDGSVELIKREHNKSHCEAFWASGGQAAFSREKWLKLGGFDLLYKPFYWEDIDLSYRALKRGYKIIWEPLSVVKHEHVGVIREYFRKDYIDLISERNHLLFIWKNIADTEMFSSHGGYLCRRLRHLGYFKPFSAALMKLPNLIKQRRVEKQQSLISDREIFGKFINF